MEDYTISLEGATQGVEPQEGSAGANKEQGGVVDSPKEQEGGGANVQTELTPEEKQIQDYINRHYEFIKSQNYITVDDDYEFDGNLEKLYAQDFERRTKALEQNIVQSMPEPLQKIVDYGLTASRTGNLDLNTVVGFVTQQEQLKQLDLDDEEVAEGFLLNHYKGQGLKDVAAKAAITAYKDEGNLQDVAKEIEQKMLAENERQLQEYQAQVKQQEKQERERQQNYMNQLEAGIAEAEWQKATKEQVRRDLYNGTATKKIEHIVSNDPKAMIELLKFLHKYDPEKGFSQPTDIVEKNNATKQVHDDMFKVMMSQQASAQSGTRSNNKAAAREIEYDSISIFNQ